MCVCVSVCVCVCVCVCVYIWVQAFMIDPNAYRKAKFAFIYLARLHKTFVPLDVKKKLVLGHLSMADIGSCSSWTIKFIIGGHSMKMTTTTKCNVKNLSLTDIFCLN